MEVFWPARVTHWDDNDEDDDNNKSNIQNQIKVTKKNTITVFTLYELKINKLETIR